MQMKLKLKIIKDSDSSFSVNSEFCEFPVFLGRENNNQIILPDPLKIVSRKHAKIINTEGILQLVDLESANFTHLNGQKIVPNDENALKSGDTIRIGDYELAIEIVRDDRVNEDDQKTRIFTSPYAEEIAAIAENLRKISAKYSFEDSPAKDKMLRLSVLQNLTVLDKSESNIIISECLSENFLNRELLKSFSDERQNGGKNFISPGIKEVFSPPHNGFDHKPVTQEYSFNIHFSNTIDVFLDIFIKLIEGFLQFRQEFFGVTKFYTLPTGSPEEVKDFLFNPNISPEEEKKRLDTLKDEAQKLLGHQIGLLEGYNLSVTEGSKMLLQSLDPYFIEKGLETGKAFEKIFPFSKKLKALELIKEHYGKYISDPYYIEKKFFRPSFMRGYQKRI